MIYKKINKCRISKKNDLVTIFKVDNFGLTGTFPKNKNVKLPKTPLHVVFSQSSKLLQLKHNYNPKILYGKNYGYRSGLNPTMVNHLKNKSSYLKKKYKFNKNKDLILDVGANDGTFLQEFKNLKRYAVDPSLAKFKNFYDKKTVQIAKRFEDAFVKIKNKKFKFITCVAMFYDLEDPVNFLKKIKYILSEKGILHIEIAYLPEIIKTFSYDTFCQEHYEYYSLMSINYLFDICSMKILEFGFNNINGGSIWLDVTHKDSKLSENKSKLIKFLKKEKEEKIDKIQTYKNFFKKVLRHSNNLNSLINKITKSKKIVYGYGASTKGNVLLQLSKLDNRTVKGIFDVNHKKFNTFTPLTNIKIIDEKKLSKFKMDYMLVLIWHYKNYVIKKIKSANKSIKIIVPFPKIKII
jgi:SAM-dependent methyltransferase